MHLQGLSTQHGKSTSVVASQGTSRASSPGPDRQQESAMAADQSQQSASPAVPSRTLMQNVSSKQQARIELSGSADAALKTALSQSNSAA